MVGVNYILLLGSAFIVSSILCFSLIKLVKNYYFIDNPNGQKPQISHQNKTPRNGGIALFISSCLLFVFPFGWHILLPASFAFLSGLIEDFRSVLGPKVRLFLQICAAILGIIFFNALIFDVGIGWYFPLWLSVCFSIFAIVGCINAINIIDGLNGLASGISLMVLLSFGIVSYLENAWDLLLICSVLVASLLGFMLFNFPNGKIFLGDGGAYFLGFMIVMIAIKLGELPSISPWFVLCVVIYPIWEVLFSIYRRKKRKQQAMQPDKFHLHTLLFKRRIHNNSKTSLFLWFLYAPFVFVPIIYRDVPLLLIATILLFIALYNFYYYRLVTFKGGL